MSAANSKLTAEQQRILAERQLQQRQKNDDILLRETVAQRLVESGEEARLRSLVSARLRECGWREQMREACRMAIKEKGLNISADELVNSVQQQGEQAIPEGVRAELLDEVLSVLNELFADTSAPTK